MNKTFRHAQIQKLIRTRPINTQEEIAKELKKLGIDVTQVTLSRDIRELRLVKTHDGYKQIIPESTGPRLASVAAEVLRDIRSAQNLLVLKTVAGNANALAVALDQENWPEVVGTIAGDDTILVVTPDTETAGTLRDKLLYFLAE